MEFQICSLITLQHTGIIFSIMGTVFLAFSVKTETQYRGDKFMEDCVDRARKDNGFVPTYTYIDKKLFITGLLFVAIGSLLQW